MEHKNLVVFFVVIWMFYVVAIHEYGIWKSLRQAYIFLSHAAPSVAAISMTCVFLIGNGATTAQHVAYSEKGIEMWSMWAGLWPFLLLATGGASIAQAVIAVVVVVKPGLRVWLPVAALGTGMCVFSLLTVASNFPDA